MDTKQEIFNLVIHEYCPDDMESWDCIISFEVASTVADPADALEDAVTEYMEQMKDSLEEDEKITWRDIRKNMPNELFAKHGLYRRDVTNRVESVFCDAVPYAEEE